jgi:pyruvate,water dikinase
VGGKAWGLAALAGAGVRVPAWLVVPADALAEHLDALGLTERVGAELARLAAWRGAEPDARREAARAARALAPALAPLAPDAALAAALADAVRALGPGPFAVRSSAAGEDGGRHSFAGQFESVLGPRDAHEVAAAVARCWRSAFAARALDYRRRAGALADAPGVGVIVQRLVAGDASGVLFTTDPLTGDARRMRASACWGLGETLVGGRGAADEFLLARDGRVLEAHVADKTTRVVAAAGGTREEPVPDALRRARTLDDAALATLAAAGRRVADHAGAARDVEWTAAGGELFVLQARPVTATTRPAAPAVAPGGDGPNAAPDPRRRVWDNSNIQESYYGVTTPLTFSFASAAYASVYEQTMRALGLSERAIAAHRPLLRNLLGLLDGRVYYNLDNWYRGLRLLPAFRRNKADMERMMGVDEPVDFVAEEPDGALAALGRAPRLARALAGLLCRFATLPRDTERFLARVDRATRAVDRGALAAADLGVLMAALDRARAECTERWTAPIVNDVYTMTCVGRLRRLVARAAPGRADALLQTLLGGADVAVSAGPAMLLLRMAALARADAALARTLDAPNAADALAAARAASPGFAALLAELHDRYGDRGMGELKLESRALRDDPAFVVRVLRNYLAPGAAGAPADPERLAADARVARERAEQEVARALGPLGRARLRRALGAARRAIRAREAMRLARTRVFGLHRDLYRAVGARLAERGRLDAPDDVFYLTTAEVAEYWEGRAVSADLAAVARARRAEYARYAAAPPLPNRVVTAGAPYDALRPGPGAAPPADASNAGASNADVPEAGRVLRGLGCSPGVAEGPVRVVTSPDDDLALAGHVLVAPRTDPGWAPLFPSAAAVVVERGSLLSHSAVLARELGLPAVVGIPGVVAALRDGERVRVDGLAGTVERLEAR